MNEWINRRFARGGPRLLMPVLVMALAGTAGTAGAAPFTQGPPGPLLMSQGSILFPPTPVGKTFTYSRASALANISSTSVTITSVAITGANAGDFSVATGCTGGTLAPHFVCTVVVSFAPSATGDRNALLVITPSSGGALTVPLFGTGGTGGSTSGGGGGGGGGGGTFTSGQVSVTPGSLNFGNQNVNTGNSTLSVTITNSGTTPLAIFGVSITGVNASDFKITADTGDVGFAPGGLRFVTIKFTPSAAGTRTASLVITSSSPGSPFPVPLTGVGVVPK